MSEQATPPLYRIRNWDEYYENNRTRALKKISWIPIPNKHDGDGYSELICSPDGPLLFAAWILILQVASKCSPRGTLMRDSDKPHNPHSLSRMTRVGPEIFEKAITKLLEIGWLEQVIEITSQSGMQVPDTDEEGKGMEGKGNEQNGIEGKGSGDAAPPIPPSADVPLVFDTEEKKLMFDIGTCVKAYVIRSGYRKPHKFVFDDYHEALTSPDYKEGFNAAALLTAIQDYPQDPKKPCFSHKDVLFSFKKNGPKPWEKKQKVTTEADHKKGW